MNNGKVGGGLFDDVEKANDRVVRQDVVDALMRCRVIAAQGYGTRPETPSARVLVAEALQAVRSVPAAPPDVLAAEVAEAALVKARDRVVLWMQKTKGAADELFNRAPNVAALFDDEIRQIYKAAGIALMTTREEMSDEIRDLKSFEARMREAIGMDAFKAPEQVIEELLRLKKIERALEGTLSGAGLEESLRKAGFGSKGEHQLPRQPSMNEPAKPAAESNDVSLGSGVVHAAGTLSTSTTDKALDDLLRRADIHCATFGIGQEGLVFHLTHSLRALRERFNKVAEVARTEQNQRFALQQQAEPKDVNIASLLRNLRALSERDANINDHQFLRGLAIEAGSVITKLYNEVGDAVTDLRTFTGSDDTYDLVELVKRAETEVKSEYEQRQTAVVDALEELKRRIESLPSPPSCSSSEFFKTTWQAMKDVIEMMLKEAKEGASYARTTKSSEATSKDVTSLADEVDAALATHNSKGAVGADAYHHFASLLPRVSARLHKQDTRIATLEGVLRDERARAAELLSERDEKLKAAEEAVVRAGGKLTGSLAEHIDSMAAGRSNAWVAANTNKARADKLERQLDAAWEAAKVPVRGMVELDEVIADLCTKRDEALAALGKLEGRRLDRTVTAEWMSDLRSTLVGEKPLKGITPDPEHLIALWIKLAVDGDENAQKKLDDLGKHADTEARLGHLALDELGIRKGPKLADRIRDLQTVCLKALVALGTHSAQQALELDELRLKGLQK